MTAASHLHGGVISVYCVSGMANMFPTHTHHTYSHEQSHHASAQYINLIHKTILTREHFISFWLLKKRDYYA